MSHDQEFAKTPEPPYYAVVFSSQRKAGDDGYDRMVAAMMALAQEQPGYLGRETARGSDGFGITVSYWADAASIKHWKAVSEHHAAQVMGYKRWYEHYTLRVARVERDYSGPEGRSEILSKAAAPE